MTDHSHHWRIEEPQGTFSLGQCSCGAQKQFRNYQPDDFSSFVNQANRYSSKPASEVKARIADFHERREERLPETFHPWRDRTQGPGFTIHG